MLIIWASLLVNCLFTSFDNFSLFFGSVNFECFAYANINSLLVLNVKYFSQCIMYLLTLCLILVDADTSNFHLIVCISILIEEVFLNPRSQSYLLPLLSFTFYF